MPGWILIWKNLGTSWSHLLTLASEDQRTDLQGRPPHEAGVTERGGAGGGQSLSWVRISCSHPALNPGSWGNHRNRCLSFPSTSFAIRLSGIKAPICIPPSDLIPNCGSEGVSGRTRPPRAARAGGERACREVLGMFSNFTM